MKLENTHEPPAKRAIDAVGARDTVALPKAPQGLQPFPAALQ